MSPPVRYALIAAFAVVALLFVRAQQPTAPPSAAAAPVKHQPFPAELVGATERLPPPGATLQARIEQQLASADAMWTAAFADAGATYDPPRLETSVDLACGVPTGGWSGLYCPKTKTLVIDLQGHVERQQFTGAPVSDVVLAYTVAHEVGHHVQMLRGAPARESLETAKRQELQADCLAGVWGKAAGLPLPPTWKYGADEVHGTSGQRMRWLSRGYMRARPADCDAIWTGVEL